MMLEHWLEDLSDAPRPAQPDPLGPMARTCMFPLLLRVLNRDYMRGYVYHSNPFLGLLELGTSQGPHLASLVGTRQRTLSSRPSSSKKS